MKYIVIGAGGIGCATAAYLAAGGKDTALIARGAQLEAIRKNGLKSVTNRLGELHIKDMKAYSPDDDFEKADVVFVCVKGYSLMETVPLIAKAAHEKTVVIPILNSLYAGERLGDALPGVCVLGGGIYCSSFVNEPGVVVQPTPLFRIVFGAREGHPADTELLKRIGAELTECSIDYVISPCIEREIFKKFTFISAFASTDTSFDVAIGAIQKPGKERDMFIALVNELKIICDAKGYEMDIDLVGDTIKMLDGFSPDIMSSMHRDNAAGKNTEKQELVFDVLETAKKLGVNVPEYEKAAKFFGYKG